MHSLYHTIVSFCINVVDICCRIILQQVKLSNCAIAITGLLMSILGCALMADWQAISYDKCTHFSPYHNPSLSINKTMETLMHGDTQLKIQKSSGNTKHPRSIITPPFGERISCSINDDISGCKRKYNECHLIQYSPGIEFDMYTYPCEFVYHDKHVKAYTCQSNWNQSFCLHVNETRNEFEVSAQSLAASVHMLMTKRKYKDAMKRCTQADVGGDQCLWIPDSPITKHYCSDCEPICRAQSKALNFAQFCIGAAMLMLSIPVAWVPVASMASERITNEMQVYLLY